jgi:hypothetical protein
VSNCGTQVTYTQAPTRAATDDISTTEDLIALGLDSKMIGESAASGNLPSGQLFPAEFAGGFKHVREVSPNSYFTLEQLAGGVRPPSRPPPGATVAARSLSGRQSRPSCAHDLV